MIEAAIENGVVGTASKREGLHLLLVEEDLPITIVEILVTYLQAWTLIVLEEAHETVRCLSPRLRPSHLNHLFMVMVEQGEMDCHVDVDGLITTMNIIIEPKSAVDLLNRIFHGELNHPQVSLKISLLFLFLVLQFGCSACVCQHVCSVYDADHIKPLLLKFLHLAQREHRSVKVLYLVYQSQLRPVIMLAVGLQAVSMFLQNL